MKLRPAATLATLVALLFSASPLSAAAESHKLAELDKAPDGLSDQVAARLNPHGFRVEGPDGPIVDIWLAKDLGVTPNFKPSLSVKYPFTAGALIGALRVPKGKIYTDFRGQELSEGTYTLRYGKQPEDGNHIGTSELADFLLAIPAKGDTDPKPIATFEDLSQKSAKSAGSTHPAIFSLLPADEKDAGKKPALLHDESKEFWILSVSADGKQKDEPVKVPLRLVTIGRSEA